MIRKKILSILLVSLLFFSSMPLNVFADIADELNEPSVAQSEETITTSSEVETPFESEVAIEESDLVEDSQVIEAFESEPLETKESSEEAIQVTESSVIAEESQEPELDSTPNSQQSRGIAKDVLNLVTVLGMNIRIDSGAGFKDYIVDGKIVEGAKPPRVGDSIQINYLWEITKENLAEIAENDYFSFPLPVNFFDYNDTGDYDLLSGVKEKLGTFKIKDNKIIVTLNKQAVEKDSLKKGFVFGIGSIVKEGKVDEIEIPGVGFLPPFEITKPDPGNGSEIPHERKGKPIEKTGSQIVGENQIKWSISVNYDNQIKRFRGDNFQPLNNAFVVDKLEGKQTFNSLLIKTVYYTATSTGEMSKNTLMNGDEFVLPRIDALASEKTLAEYQARLKLGGKAAYGLFEDQVVIYFGPTLPGSELIMSGQEYTKIKERLVKQRKAGILSQKAYEETLKHYEDGIENQSIAFRISLFTDVEGSSDSLSNTAILMYDGENSESSTAKVKFQEIGGGVEAIEARVLEVIKKDDEGNRLVGIQFKIQKKDENGNYVDYQAPDSAGGVVRATNQDGKIRFSRLESGEYQIVEVTKDTAKYGNPIYSPSNRFTIKDADVEGIGVEVMNPLLTSVSVEKAWDDNDNQDGIRPSSVQIQLYGDNQKIGQPMTLNEGNQWKYQWEGLPKNNDKKQEIQYTVKETNVPKGYLSSVVLKGSVNLVKNIHVPEEIDISGEKIWEDENDKAGQRPAEISVQLLADGAPVATQTVNQKTKWRYQFAALPKFKNGKEITYTISEVPVKNYKTTIEGFNIRNTYEPDATEKTSLKVKKVWNDKQDEAKKRPTSIKVQLYANGIAYGSPVQVTEKLNWTYEWVDLPKLMNGVVVSYTVVEKDVPKGYSSSIAKTESGFTITNTYHKPVDPPQKTSLKVKKVWNDKQDEAKKRPTSIKVQLYANGIAYGSPVQVTEKLNWTYEWVDLPKLMNGVVVSYTVVEKDVSKGYSSSIAKTESGFTITNTYHKPTEPPKEPNKPKDPPPGSTLPKTGGQTPPKKTLPKTGGQTTPKNTLPKTGEESALWLSILGLALVITVWRITYTIKRRSE